MRAAQGFEHGPFLFCLSFFPNSTPVGGDSGENGDVGCHDGAGIWGTKGVAAVHSQRISRLHRLHFVSNTTPATPTQTLPSQTRHNGIGLSDASDRGLEEGESRAQVVLEHINRLE